MCGGAGASCGDDLPVTHELKCWPPWFQDVQDGKKTFEVRKNDRGYKVGDILMLREWKPETKTYTGRICNVKVTYIMPGVQLFNDGVAYMSIVRVK